MVLQVPLDQLAKTAHRVLGVSEVFLVHRDGRSIATAGKPGGNMLIRASSALAADEVRTKLVEAKLEVFDGEWSLDDTAVYDEDECGELFVGGISYRTDGDSPGIWIDAFREQPTHAQVLRSMYEEMTGTGEMPSVSFEEFVRLANPTVVVASPTELKEFATKNIRKSDI